MAYRPVTAKGTVDGLIGLWALSFKPDGTVDLQFQIIRRSGDSYICKVHSWENGQPSHCIVIPRHKLMALSLYESTQGLGVAYRRLWGEQQRRWEAEQLEAIADFLPPKRKPDGATAH